MLEKQKQEKIWVDNLLLLGKFSRAVSVVHYGSGRMIPPGDPSGIWFQGVVRVRAGGRGLSGRK